MPGEADNGANLGAFMESIEEPYIEEPGENVQGLYNLKASNLLNTNRSRGALALGDRKSYDYVPKYAIEAAEEAVRKYYNPETQTLALPSTPGPLALPAGPRELTPAEKLKEAEAKVAAEPEPYIYGVTKGPRFRRAYGMGTEQAEVPEVPSEKRTFQKNGQKITEEVIPIAPKGEVGMSTQPITMPPPTEKMSDQETEKPIAAFTAPTEEDKLKDMIKEIDKLKKEQETLKRIRDAKLERLKLKWHNISASIKAKHPVITSLVERAIKAAPGIGKAALSAGKSFAQGLGNLATKIADPYARQQFANTLDYNTRDFTPEGSYQNPIDRINGIPFRPPLPQAQQPQAIRPNQMAAPSNSDLQKEADKLRLERSIITQRAQLANQKAILTGKPAPYPSVPTYTPHERRHRRKSLREIVGEIEKTKAQKELEKERKLAVA